MSLAALIVAILSLVVAVSALSWQVISWRLNGGRVRAKLVHGIAGRGGVVVAPVARGSSYKNVEQLREHGWHGAEVLGIEVTNTGRANVQVTGFAFWHPSSKAALSFPAGNALSPQLPCFVEPGTTKAWYADLEDGRAMVRAMNAAEQTRGNTLQMRVTLGTGQAVTASGSLRV